MLIVVWFRTVQHKGAAMHPAFETAFSLEARLQSARAQLAENPSPELEERVRQLEVQHASAVAGLTAAMCEA